MATIAYQPPVYGQLGATDSFFSVQLDDEHEYPVLVAAFRAVGLGNWLARQNDNQDEVRINTSPQIILPLLATGFNWQHPAAMTALEMLAAEMRKITSPPHRSV